MWLYSFYCTPYQFLCEISEWCPVVILVQWHMCVINCDITWAHSITDSVKHIAVYMLLYAIQTQLLTIHSKLILSSSKTEHSRKGRHPVANRRMVALYDYDPRESSPNVDVEVFKHTHTHIYVFMHSRDFDALNGLVYTCWSCTFLSRPNWPSVLVTSLPFLEI